MATSGFFFFPMESSPGNYSGAQDFDRAMNLFPGENANATALPFSFGSTDMLLDLNLFKEFSLTSDMGAESSCLPAYLGGAEACMPTFDLADLDMKASVCTLSDTPDIKHEDMGETEEQTMRRLHNKRKPRREDYPTATEFAQAWQRWRDDRDHNNRSVKQSRQRSKQRRLEEERRFVQNQSETLVLEQQLAEIQQEMTFLLKVVQQPAALNAQEQEKVKQLLRVFQSREQLLV